MNDDTDPRYRSSQRDELWKLVKVWSQFLLWFFMPGRYPSSWPWCALHEQHTIGHPWRVKPYMLHRPPGGLPGCCTEIGNPFCTWLLFLWPNIEKVVFSTDFPWIFDIVISDECYSPRSVSSFTRVLIVSRQGHSLVTCCLWFQLLIGCHNLSLSHGQSLCWCGLSSFS